MCWLGDGQERGDLPGLVTTAAPMPVEIGLVCASAGGTGVASGGPGSGGTAPFQRARRESVSLAAVFRLIRPIQYFGQG